MAVAAPFAWGDGRHVELPDWMTTVSGLLFAAPAVFIGASTLRETLRRTRGGFSVFHLQLFSGVFLFLILSLIELALVARITDPDTYNSLRDPDGTISTTPLAFFLITLVATAFATGWLSVASYLFSHGITSENAFRFERSLDEPDLMGELLRGQRPRM